jgi:hypothetical protein
MGEYATWNPASFHPRGIDIALGDGSIRFIMHTIESWQSNPNTGDPRGSATRCTA